MSTPARQLKGSRKGPPEPAPRRAPAWTSTGARASPTYSSTNTPPRPSPATVPTPPASFPPLAQPNGASRPDNPRDRVLQALSGLTGTTITLVTKTNQRFEGVVLSTNGEGDTMGVSLKDVKDIANPGTPLKDQFFIPSTNIETYFSGPADAKTTNGDSFRTDTDISQKKAGGRERDLQAWVPTGDPHPAVVGNLGLPTDDDTFGSSANGNISWDQFSANEQLFGVKASFDEDVYTTKLDRSAPDFKERERKAQRIANEIIGATTSNPHVAEERGIVDDSGVNEEDKYGAVVRGQNAYVPPGARRGGVPVQPAASVNATQPAKADIPKVSVNGPDGTTVAAQAQSPPSSNAPSPAPTTANAVKPPADPLPAFRDFVTNEKQRLTQKRQQVIKNEMDKRMADLVEFSKSFKLNKPIPEDLVPILAKDQDKQRAIKEKASKDAASGHARVIGASATISTGRTAVAVKIQEAARKPVPQTLASKNVATSSSQTPIAAPAQKHGLIGSASTSNAKASEGPNSKKINMVIQTIPPFKGSKGKSAAHSGGSNPNGTPPANAHRSSAASPAITSPVSPNTAANRLNVNASSFRPNPKANTSTPVAPSPSKPNASNSASASLSPKAKPDAASFTPTPNPFFGSRPIKKSTPVHVKDDFNPFKHNKVADASQITALWPYNGKRYMQMFPPPQHQPNQQHPPHMGPPGPPPMPPPSYEEDSAAQAAARGYVYAYPPYGYPQHMMPGMAPPGPPGPYMPGPYMQHMPYPPGMPPPNTMYSPGMGQMPPPQAYMQQPPPGAYPPPPNGAGPRPSMPPTPIPTHAHPYYHQSPQLQHAYPMMMPPPPNLPPHPYDGGPAPPVPMGGHA